MIKQFINKAKEDIVLLISFNYRELLLGVDIGGIGTLIASLASVISYKFYAENYKTQKKKYLLRFSIYNITALLVFGIIFWIII